MSPLKGNKSAFGLAALLHSVIDYTDHASKSDEPASLDRAASPQDQAPHSQTERPMAQKKSSILSGGAITAFVSLVALFFSGYSFYETVLKQPVLKVYAPPLIHMYRKDYKDILAFPITISNDGAKRGTVLSFDLEVTNKATNESKRFKNLYYGNDPKDTSRIFTPMTVAGRTSLTDVVMFRAAQVGAFFKTTGGVKLDLHLKLILNVDETEFWIAPEPKQSLSFDVQASFIQSFRAMETGKPTVLYRLDEVPSQHADTTKSPEVPLKQEK